MVTSYDDQPLRENAYASVRADDALPPVEPPSAGFILQLFVIPAAIVGVVVGFTLLFNVIASRQTEPKYYIDQLKLGRTNSWQAAHDLAVELQRNPLWRQDPVLVAEVTKVLRTRLESRIPSSEADALGHVQLVSYLCRVLTGCVLTEDSQAALFDALKYDRGDSERDPLVRAVAVEAISAALGSGRSDLSEMFGPQLLEASRDENPLVRSRAGFGLGLLDPFPETARERLKAMLIDGQENVHFNAATSLARVGDESSMETLVDMLTLRALTPEEAQAEGPRQKNERESRTVLILEAGMGAVAELKKRGVVESSELRQSLETISAGPAELPSGAKEHLIALAKATLKVTKEVEAANPKVLPLSSALFKQSATP